MNKMGTELLSMSKCNLMVYWNQEDWSYVNSICPVFYTSREILTFVYFLRPEKGTWSLPIKPILGSIPNLQVLEVTCNGHASSVGGKHFIFSSSVGLLCSQWKPFSGLCKRILPCLLCIFFHQVFITVLLKISLT